MSGFGGATHGRVWFDCDFVELHNRIRIGDLLRAGALRDGAEMVLAWNGGLKGSCRFAHGEIFLSIGEREQTLRVDWLPFLNNRFVRPRFFCPGCGRGAYHLHEKSGLFACRTCCRYDNRSDHRQRYSNAWRRIAKLRAALGADPRPVVGPIPPPPRRRGQSLARWRRLIVELARAERVACGDISRLLANLEQRAKTKAEP